MKGADTCLVQCKQWRARSVGVVPVREWYGVMAAQRVAGGFVVTSGEFTDEARCFASGREIQPINGKALQAGVSGQASAASKGAKVATAHRAPPRLPEIAALPLCPLCSAPMVMRQARSGASAGKSFWGCSQYAQTKCRGIRRVARAFV